MPSDGGQIGLTSRRPRPPERADFAIRIDFKRGEGNPYRIFQAADSMIRALQKLDKALCAAIDNRIEPIMVLEEIEAGSLRIWLHNILTAVDDDALKKLDWKPAVGKYLVRAKHAYIRWSNKESVEDASLAALGREIMAIARETDVLEIPAYSPPSIQELADATAGIETAKSLLIPEDRITYIAPDEPEIDFDLRISWVPDELLALSIKETVKFENNKLTLIVRRPDYLGTTKWDFRHGRRQISAKIEDISWLRKFQARQTDVRPGDALRCIVTTIHSYGYDNELIKEEFVVTTVIEVMENTTMQLPLFADDGQKRTP